MLGAALKIIVVFGLLLAGNRAHAQESPPPEAAGLDVSLPAAKRLAGVRDLIALEQWDAAIDSLHQIADEFGDRLVEAEPGRLLNVRDASSAALARLPAEGLARLRQRIDPAMRSLFEESRRRHDAALMRQVVRDGFAGSDGDEALNWLAEDAWSKGDLDLARAYWTMLVPAPPAADGLPVVPRYPDSNLDLADIRARLILCSIMQHDNARVVDELEAFQRLHPEARGRLCGRDGDLAEILADEWMRSTSWARPESRGWPTFSAGSDRNGIAPRLPVLGVPLWSSPLPISRLPVVSAARPALPDFGNAACFPVVWQDTVLINDARTVRALDLHSGLPKWPTGDLNDQGVLYSDPLPGNSLQWPTAGVPRFSASVDDGLYVARVGLPVVVPAAGAIQLPESHLICLDLAGAEGRLAWTTTPDGVLSSPGWQFSGAPLLLEERLYVALRRASPQVEFGVACLSLRTGTAIWERRVAATLEQAPALHHLVDHDLLTAAQGLVFCAPGSGVVAALEQDSGSIRWARIYASHAEEPDAASDPSVRRLTPPLYYGGTLYVAPPDSDRVLALDAGSGAEIWNVPSPDRITHLLGVVEQMLVAQGDRLIAIDVRTGGLRHPPLGFDDPEGFGFGRGVIAGRSVFWTTHDELFEVDAGSWSIVRRVPLREQCGWTGGNLLVAGDMLLISQPDRIGALGPRGDDTQHRE